MALSMGQFGLPSLRESFRDHTLASSYVAFMGLLAVLAVLLVLVDKPVVAALTVSFGIILTLMVVFIVLLPVSALSLLD